jgi:hypothetical protein
MNIFMRARKEKLVPDSEIMSFINLRMILYANEIFIAPDERGSCIS